MHSVVLYEMKEGSAWPALCGGEVPRSWESTAIHCTRRVSTSALPCLFSVLLFSALFSAR